MKKYMDQSDKRSIWIQVIKSCETNYWLLYLRILQHISVENPYIAPLDTLYCYRDDPNTSKVYLDQ